MIPATHNLNLYRNVVFSMVVTCIDSAGDPVDLTGWAVSALMSREVGSNLTYSLGATITDAANGQITMSLTAAQTLALPLGTFQWDLVLSAPGPIRQGPYLKGTVSVTGVVS